MTTSGDFADLCEELAATLAMSRGIARTELDGAEPITTRFASVRSAQGVDRALFIDTKPTDLERPIRYSIVLETGERTGYSGFGIRRLAAKEQRGLPLPFPSLHHCRCTISLMVPMTGESIAGVQYASYHQREHRWLFWRVGERAHYDEALERQAQVALGAQFSARYDWRVLLGFPNAPRVALPCARDEASKLFKTRELPPGRQRRAALRHWVNEHWRQREDKAIAVRSHMRGTSDFHWDGLECSIVPSEEDRDRAGRLPEPPKGA